MGKGIRPWEGTVLAVVDIISVVFAFLGAIAMLFLAGATGGMMSFGMMGGGFFGGLGLAGGIIFIALGVLGVFMAIGAFKGQKWSPIVSAIAVILGLLMLIVNLFTLGFTNGFVVSVLIQLFVGYCAYAAIKHPYYN